MIRILLAIVLLIVTFAVGLSATVITFNYPVPSTNITISVTANADISNQSAVLSDGETEMRLTLKQYYYIRHCFDNIFGIGQTSLPSTNMTLTVELPIEKVDVVLKGVK